MVQHLPPILLPLRCEPVAGESLNGFLMRLAERNGRRHPREILGDVAKVFPGYTATPEELAHLHVLSGRPITELMGLCSWQVGPTKALLHTVSYAGQVLSGIDLLGFRRQVCPECLSEQAYHRQHWDLLVLGDCARHGRELLSRCPACQDELTWRSGGLTKCQCGQGLSEVPTQASHADRKALAAFLEGRMTSPQPEEPPLLKGLDLYQAIEVMKLLGALHLGLRPWGTAGLVADGRRHDVIAIGFVLAGQPTAKTIELLNRLADLLEFEPTKPKQLAGASRWMLASGNAGVRQLGEAVFDRCGVLPL